MRYLLEHIRRLFHERLLPSVERPPLSSRKGRAALAGKLQAMEIWTAREEEMDTARELFREYQEFLGFDLCFQDFERELAELPGAYREPQGCLLLAGHPHSVVGCIGLRPLNDHECEMKRLYVRPTGRSRGLGRRLCLEVIQRARRAGYQRMKLDTVSKLEAAITLYRDLGFRPCAPYCDNPRPDVEYYELKLQTVPEITKT